MSSLLEIVGLHGGYGRTEVLRGVDLHVNAGEVTDSHRHTATSVYFMIQGSGIYTTAQGEQRQFLMDGIRQ